MDATNARAKLAELAAEDGSPTVATTLERADVEEALGVTDGPPELILEILRRSEGEEQRVQLAIEWGREDLEELLRRAEGSPLILQFDAESIEEALRQDVEAHGFREKAVILAAVAATAAGAGAGSAAAVPDLGDPAGATPVGIEQVTRPDDAAGPRTTPATTGAAAAADEYGMPRAMPSDYPADQYGMPRAMPSDYPADEYGMPRAMPADYPAPEYGMPRAMPTDYPAGETGGGGFVVPAPSPGEATLITGGIALLIAGAAFAATRRREDISPA